MSALSRLKWSRLLLNGASFARRDIPKRTQIRPPPSIYPWLPKGYGEERPLADKSWVDLVTEQKNEEPVIDIGAEVLSRGDDQSAFRKQLQQNRHNKELEQQARLGKLLVPLDEVQDDYRKENGPLDNISIAKHYGIYKDLFNGAYFTPVVDLDIAYDYDDDYVNRVFTGNQILPIEAVKSPSVFYEVEEENSLWTLILTSPDSHLQDESKEYLHWMIGNIPSNKTENGEVLCDYFQPFPAKGTGFHRFIFILFKQDNHIDFTEKLPHNCCSLKERTFSTCDFYRKYNEKLTPMGLAFFLSEYDDSVQAVFHHTLNMREPAFEYQHPVSYRRPLTKFPHKEPFNRYFDRYRDKKEIAEQVLKMKLNMISPFKPHPPRPNYPMIHRAQGYRPSWLKRQDEVMHRRQEQFKDLP